VADAPPSLLSHLANVDHLLLHKSEDYQSIAAVEAKEARTAICTTVRTLAARLVTALHRSWSKADTRPAPQSNRRPAAGGVETSASTKLPLSAHTIEVKADATAADATDIASAGLPGLYRSGNAALAIDSAESVTVSYPAHLAILSTETLGFSSAPPEAAGRMVSTSGIPTAAIVWSAPVRVWRRCSSPIHHHGINFDI
jgi:hypothetical protein